MNLLWRIYYGDGSTIDNTQSSVFDLPTQNVQAIVQFDDEVGRIVLHRFDYYYWLGSRWRGSDIGGFWDYLFHHRSEKYVLFGRTLSNAAYKAILQSAIDDTDFKE